LLTFIVKLPRVSVALVSIGTWIPQRGSGPIVVLDDVPSGNTTLSERSSLCSVSVRVAWRPFGQMLVCRWDVWELDEENVVPYVLLTPVAVFLFRV
jgi:hypothetical protein